MILNHFYILEKGENKFVQTKKSDQSWQHIGELLLIENGLMTASVDIICEANQES